VNPNLRELSANLLATVFAFRAASNDERRTYRVLRQEVTDLIRQFEQHADRERLDPNGYARFALVALVDESVMSSDWGNAAEWAREPLQMHYYGDFTAGDRFFPRLEELQVGADEDMLELYFICLCAGFRGRYRDDPAMLSSIRTKLFQRLSVPGLRDEPHLTPEAYGRNLERPLMTRRFRLWWLLPFAAAALGLYVAYYAILEGQVRDIERLSTVGTVASARR
jgi:type VI secretion system protein ImpK